jgi:acyl carrier protein
MTPSDVEALILQALENLNEEHPADRKLNVRPEMVLFGRNAELDSLSLVSLVVEVETLLNNRHGIDVVLADERAMARDVLPFTNVGTLRDYIVELIG